jgi:Alcohol acetyltransferase.
VGDVLKVALANLVLKLPSLTVGILGQDTSKPQFVQVSSIQLEHHLLCIEDGSCDPNAWDTRLLGMLQDQHDQLWPSIESRPPWRVIVIKWTPSGVDSHLVLDVVFAVHHSLADGRSTGVFHSMLLEELNSSRGPPAQLVGNTLMITGTCKLPHPQEKVIRFTISWAFFLKTLWHELTPTWLHPQSLERPWTGSVITCEPCHTRLRLVTVSATLVPQLLATCRQYQTTLTPLLHILVLVSLARRLAPHEAQAFRSSTPIDLRPFASDTFQDSNQKIPFGVYVTAQSHFFDASVLASLRTLGEEAIKNGTVWKMAAKLRSQMKQRLDSLPKDDITSLLGWVSDWKGFWLSKVGQSRNDTWEVSNIGLIPTTNITDSDGWKIQRCIMSQGASVAGAAVNISVAGVPRGDICIALGWQDGIVGTGIIDGLAHDLRGWLNRLSQKMA